MNNSRAERPSYICKPATFLGLEEIPQNIYNSCLTLSAQLRSKVYLTPSYERLSRLKIRVSKIIEPRDSIQKFVEERHSFNFNSSEAMYLDQCCAAFRLILDGSIYDMAEAARSICIRTLESPRDCNLTISFLRELIIPPPLKCSDLYKPARELSQEDPVVYALKAYLILLSEHPYRDGNGRVARLVFSTIIRTKINPCIGYIPLSELTLLTFGLYEELFAHATKTGRYNEIFELLVSLIGQYIAFLDDESFEPQVPNGEIQNRNLGFSTIKALPPLKFTFDEFFCCNSHLYDKLIFDAIKNLAHELQQYGAVNYALFTDRAESGKAHSRPAITYFITAESVEDLTKNIRLLRSLIERYIILHIIPVLDEPATDAKLLLTQYVSYSQHSKDHPLLITNFTS